MEFHSKPNLYRFYKKSGMSDETVKDETAGRVINDEGNPFRILDIGEDVIKNLKYDLDLL